MIAIILISFVICWCPFHIEKLVEIVETSRTIDENIPQADLSDPQTMCRNETLKNLDQPSHRISGFTFKERGYNSEPGTKIHYVPGMGIRAVKPDFVSYQEYRDSS